MCKFLIEHDVVPNMGYSIALYCDNTGAIAQTNEPWVHQKSKTYLE